MLRRGSSTYSKRSLTSKGTQRFHTTENFARLTRSLCLLPLLRRILSSSCLEAHLGGVFGFGRELGAIILRKDAVPAQQFGQRRARCTDERGTANVDLSATFMTDAWRGYITVGQRTH